MLLPPPEDFPDPLPEVRFDETPLPLEGDRDGAGAGAGWLGAGLGGGLGAGVGTGVGAGWLVTTGRGAGVMVRGLPVLTLPLPRLATYVGVLGR